MKKIVETTQFEFKNFDQYLQYLTLRMLIAGDKQLANHVVSVVHAELLANPSINHQENKISIDAINFCNYLKETYKTDS